jgi:hypothetical protein
MNVHVFVPAQAGSAEGEPALTISVLPQLSVTVGGVGATANPTQATVEPPGAGIVTTGAEMV